MFLPTDLFIRPFKSEDQDEISRMITYVQNEEEQKELRRQIKKMFIDPTLWILSGVAICYIGISLNLHPLLASIGVLFVSLLTSKRHFQQYWAEIKKIFTLGKDLEDIKHFYQGDQGDRRFFLVAQHRGRVVGTAAVSEKGDSDSKVCKLWRMFVHPATRRMGIASKLISEVKQKAKLLGYNKIELRTHATNVGAVKLYQENGFQLESESVFVEAFPLKYKVVNFGMDLEK